MHSNDTVGTSFPTQNASANYLNAQSLPVTGNTTITTTPLNNTQWWSYYPYTPDYSLTGRVAELEGQVAVLREMVAALLSNKPTTRKRVKQHV